MVARLSRRKSLVVIALLVAAGAVWLSVRVFLLGHSGARASIEVIGAAVSSYAHAHGQDPDDFRDIQPFLEHLLPGTHCMIQKTGTDSYLVVMSTSQKRHTVRIVYRTDPSGHMSVFVAEPSSVEP